MRIREARGREVTKVNQFRFPTERTLAAFHSADDPPEAVTAERGRDRAEARRAARGRRDRRGR